MSKKDRFIVIMAGGRGERFWPVSREKKPKQLITLLGGRSFLQQTVDRVIPLVSPKNILVVTNAVQAAAVRRQLPEIPSSNVVGEPCGRDTCAAVTLGAALVGARSEEAVMAVLPADHVIPDTARFRQVLRDSLELAHRQPVIVTIGIQPNEPATGYGYIQVGSKLPRENGNPPKTTFFQAKKFVEKPPLKTAIRYLKSGQYRWNAGMFVWSFPTIADELRQHRPDMFETCQRWRAISSPNRLRRVLAAEYPAMEKISIDFALMEKSRNVVCADGTFKWDDVGAWPALSRHLKSDANGNCAVGQLAQVDSNDNIVFDARTRNRSTIALVGVRESIVVLTDDATLVANQSGAQKIKQIVAKLASDKRFQHLV